VKVEGIRSAKVRGLDRDSKFFFNLSISESSSVLPGTVRKMLEDLKKESKGDDDFTYRSFEIRSITGRAEKVGEEWTFVARGSGQKYDLVPNEALKKLLAGGPAQVTLAGKLTEEQGGLRLEISDAKEPAN
jgi:hypothetical protein